MKKLLFTLMIALLSFGMASARDRVTRNVKELPATAQTTLTKYFQQVPVNHIKIDDKTFGGKEYDVILDDGTEIEFDAKGNLREVDRNRNLAVPDGLILKPIRDYVAKNFKGNKIVQFKIDRNKYEVELSNGTDLEFDRSGKFLRIDY